MSKKKRVEFRVTAKQHRAIKHKAKRLGHLSIAEYVREVVISKL